MSEGEVSSNESAGSNRTGEDGAEPKKGGPRPGDRFRAPSSSSVDLPDDPPGEDEAVQQVAKRFRSGSSPGTAAGDQKSLDEMSQGGEDVDEDSLLDALDGDAGLLEKPDEQDESGAPQAAGPAASLDVNLGDESPEANVAAVDEPEPSAEIPMVEIEPLDEESEPDADDAEESRQVVCPSCSAENPEGMRFCVECGGSLEASHDGRGASRLKGEAAGGTIERADRRDPPPPSEAAQQENPWDIEMVSINEDGSDGKTIPLDYLETTVGRDGDERFPTDAFLSPKHARFHVDDGQLYIEDLYSLNGTFIKLRDEARLTPGDTILMGRQVLRFERFEQSITPKTKSSDGTRYMGSPAPGGNYKVLQVGIGDIIQNVYCLPEDGAVLGREKGDIVFPHDKFMSGRHAQIYPGDDGQCYLVDLNSSNGTWIKIWEKTKLDDGDYIFMGQQLFRVQYGE